MPRKAKFTIDDVVGTAVEMVRKSGWEDLSVTAVAKKMGCSTMPIYSNFENLEMLKDEVVRQGWEMIMEYETRQYTGDIWVDQSIGYVFFAKAEKQLFTCMFDGRNMELQRGMLLKHWKYLAGQLDGYEGLKGLSESQRLVIRNSRALMTHGLAVSVSTGWNKMLSDDEMIMKYISVASRAVLEGYRQLHAWGDAEMQAMHKGIDDFINNWKVENENYPKT